MTITHPDSNTLSQ